MMFAEDFGVDAFCLENVNCSIPFFFLKEFIFIYSLNKYLLSI